LDIVLPRVSFGDFGRLIPRTLHEDGDPLDIIVRIDEPTSTGCHVRSRPIGVLKMLDRGEPDDKILAAAAADPLHGEWFDIADLPQHYLSDVEHFSRIYKIWRESGCRWWVGRRARWRCGWWWSALSGMLRSIGLKGLRTFLRRTSRRYVEATGLLQSW
jgi:hypothetical protein